MISILYTILFLLGKFRIDAEISVCAGKNATSSYVVNYCAEQGGEIKLRCCLSSENDTFIAIDSTDSDYTSVPDFFQDINFNLSVVDLRSNPELTPANKTDFLTLQYLNTLILPEQFDCPGGYDVWENITKTNTNDSLPVGNLCIGQKNYCSNAIDVCVQENSDCIPNGPNFFLCLCKINYHGYKCLRYGNFPSGIFFGTTACVTIVASALLYWTQRRHVKK
ncbi:unnamed protein product [Adineta ricciae]|uniref:EGF-like domain-containing protein n=1 Tax=Adineta ricciae TaxID=249248 RepID=A0A815PD03_ADIRI|nr:unnamed protein product [Adineta ricciae]CAF1447818.1 unnamed protein product [Adineta ricciae]